MRLLHARDSKNAEISSADLPRRALEIHRMRPDVQQSFDLSTTTGRRGLYWWYYIHGFREMSLALDPEEDLKGPANTPVPHLPLWGAVPVTWLMREFWLLGQVPGSAAARLKNDGWRGRFVRRVYRVTQEPQRADQQQLLIAWYFCRALSDFNLQGLLTRDQALALLADEGGQGVPRILAMVHALATDVHDRHPRPSSSGWRQWCAGEGQRRFLILAHPLLRDVLFPTAGLSPHRRRSDNSGEFGVNLIGHAGVRSGVGEDLRMAARALKSANIPFVVRDIRPSTGIPSEESELDSHLSDYSPFKFNMFCMAGMETVTMLGRRRELLDRKVNIGFWPWELPKWPELWSHAPELMDELWASTAFTAAAYRSSTQVPVRHVPMAVDVQATKGLDREAFGLPRDRFLFGYSFDGHSSFSRKNPEAVINAFCLAFPNGDEAVGLVLKGLRVGDHPAWRKLEKLAAQESRIVLMAASLARGALLDLYRSLDCFVSMHRSEGFGRNIAECILLGKPVIATNWSGNLDFTREGTAALVDAKMKQVGNGEYPFGAGQLWADPSVPQAAQHMRKIFLDQEWRARIASTGQDFIRRHHSPAVVGEKFKDELQRINHSLSKRIDRERC